MNDNLEIGIVCPLSTKIKNLAGCLVLQKKTVSGLDYDSEVLTFQIRTISKERLTKKIGEITTEEFNKLKKGLNEVLTYWQKNRRINYDYKISKPSRHSKIR